MIANIEKKELEEYFNLGIGEFTEKLKVFSIEDLTDYLEFANKSSTKRWVSTAITSRLNSLKNSLSVKKEEKNLDEVVLKEDILDIDLIKDNPHQVRKDLKEDSILNMAESIKKDGLNTPIKVFHDKKNNSYFLVSGQVRLTAYKILKKSNEEKYSKIPVLFSKKEFYTELDFRREALIENEVRTQMTTIDLATSVKKVFDEEKRLDEKLTATQFAKEIGISKSKVSRLINIAELLDKKDDFSNLVSELKVDSEVLILSISKLEGYSIEEKRKLFEDNINGLISIGKIESLKNKKVEEIVLPKNEKSKSIRISKEISSLGSLFKKYKYEDFSKEAQNKIDEKLNQIEQINNEMKKLIEKDMKE